MITQKHNRPLGGGAGAEKAYPSTFMTTQRLHYINFFIKIRQNTTTKQLMFNSILLHVSAF
jgi:hypothetical protein